MKCDTSSFDKHIYEPKACWIHDGQMEREPATGWSSSVSHSGKDTWIELWPDQHLDLALGEKTIFFTQKGAQGQNSIC